MRTQTTPTCHVAARWPVGRQQAARCTCAFAATVTRDPWTRRSTAGRLSETDDRRPRPLAALWESGPITGLAFGTEKWTTPPTCGHGLCALVRGIRPDAVLAPDPTAVFFGANYINHRDHRMVGWAVLDAVSPAAANPHYFPGPVQAYQVPVLYLSGTLEPDTWVDITPTIESKAIALACHASQIGVGGEWLGNAVRERAEEAGRLAGVPYAEAFRRVVLA